MVQKSDEALASTLADKWLAWALADEDQTAFNDPPWHDAIVGAVREALVAQRERSAQIIETGKPIGREAFWVASEAARFIRENGG